MLTNSWTTVAASIVGMVLGTAGFVMSILSYLRDRPEIKVTMKWNMITSDKKPCGQISVTNIGRRPVYIRIAALEIPKPFERPELFLEDSLNGKKIGEGDAPLNLIVPNERMPQYSAVWKRIRAYAEDSTGRRYYSRLPGKDDPQPNWVILK